MVSFPRYFTAYITYQPPFVCRISGIKYKYCVRRVMLHFALLYFLVNLWTTAKTSVAIFGDVTENRIAALFKYETSAIA